MNLLSLDQSEVLWQFGKSVSPLSQDLWPLNSAWCWIQGGAPVGQHLSRHRKHNYFDRKGYDKLIADTFNNYFADIKKILKLKKDPNFDGPSLSAITDNFKNNESVIKIKEKYDTQENSFSLTLFSKEDILKAIKSLSSNKASLIEDIPIKILKNSIHIYSEKLTNIFNECLISETFPETSKRADVTPIFKKGNNNKKGKLSPSEYAFNLFKSVWKTTIWTN